MTIVMKKTRSALSSRRPRSASSVGSANSRDSDESSGIHSRSSRASKKGGSLPPPVLVYHESARSIVFRDHLRRVADNERSNNTSEEEFHEHSPDIHQYEKEDTAAKEDYEHFSEDFSSELSQMNELLDPMGSTFMPMENQISISGFTPNIVPLPHLELGPNDEFAPLLEESDSHHLDSWTEAEREVVTMLENQQAVVKTIKNNDWTDFLHRFKTPHKPQSRYPDSHNDIPAHEKYHFNSFVTSTSILPPGGKKMRAYGAANVYTTGVVFGLPEFSSSDEEDEAAEKSRSWTWPSGYSAKTEFNIDTRGNLINGRQEAIRPFSTLRDYNLDYLHKDEYIVAGRKVKAFKTVPYNEVFIRVGGVGHIINGTDRGTGDLKNDKDGKGRTLDKGIGLPVALFVRTPTFGHLVSLLRTRARLQYVLGERHVQGIPLLLICPSIGIRVLTENLQHELLKIASKSLNPFQNPILHKTTIDNTDARQLETKVEELIDLDETIREMLTPEECVRLAGGFGATDESIAQILKDAMIQDKETQKEGRHDSHKLQDIVNEGLASAVRSGDYYTSRQLLILYSLVASEGHQLDVEEEEEMTDATENVKDKNGRRVLRTVSLDSEAMLLKRQENGLTISAENSRLPAPPPPPPLDTDRLRSATNSDGLLAVLGAAQVLKAMQDGSAKKRTEESFLSVEEWCEHGEQSMAFRLASWRDQRAAQDDLQIAFDKDSSFMAFVSNKAISNRKNFAKQLREAAKQTDFTDVRFLTAIYEMTSRMHSPCLRLELLQYVLGLDNRYSIAHVKRSVELAATCLSISASVVED